MMSGLLSTAVISTINKATCRGKGLFHLTVQKLGQELKTVEECHLLACSA